MEQIKLQTTRNEIETFKESILWSDMQAELNFWMEGFAAEQDSIVDDASSSNPSTAAVLMHLGDINGRKKAVAYMLGMLDVFLSYMEEPKDGRNKAD